LGRLVLVAKALLTRIEASLGEARDDGRPIGVLDDDRRPLLHYRILRRVD
jgi:hypothetical protein